VVVLFGVSARDARAPVRTARLDDQAAR